MVDFNIKLKCIGWSYELAHAHDGKVTRRYADWRPGISFNKPNVPEGAIRNLTPLYEIIYEKNE